METLAATEVALFRGDQRVGPQLLATAWYLHSVGSALQALRIYGVERQRTAFQVAAHIFDLALNDVSKSEEDRLRFTFAAQVANVRAALNPNAVAAYRWRLGSVVESPSMTTATVSLQVGTALLAYDTRWLFPNLERLRAELVLMRTQWIVEPTDTIFAATAHLVEGAWRLLIYLVYGTPAALGLARLEFERAVRATPSADDLDSRWVAFHLWQLADSLGGSSLWAVLPPDTPPVVPRAFTSARPSVLTLWPPQVQLLDRSRTPYALDPAVRRLVLSVPTSAGKTLLAQLLTAYHLVREGTGVCFVAPTRSLCREIEASLRGRLRLLANASDVLFADWMFSDAMTEEPRVEVMTPERLAYLLRSDPGAVLARFGLFVVDEVHAVGDPSRGWTLEWVMSCLHKMTETTKHRIVAMSAALGNRATLASWLDPTGEGVHYTSDWRGPRRVHAIYTTERDLASARSIPMSAHRSSQLTEYDLLGVLRLRPTASGRIHMLRTSRPIGKLVVKTPGYTRDVSRSTAFYKTLAPVARRLGEAGPVLVICPTRVEAARLATEISQHIRPSSGPGWLAELAAARLGAAHPLVSCIRRGVAYHHASLPNDVLIGIEEEVASGGIHYVVATTTLTEGVNLPVRTVIIAAQGAYGGGGYEEFITGARLLNAIGRAGRAGKESEGWIILARNAAFQQDDFARLTPGEADIPIQSVLASTTALDELAVLEAAIARGMDVAMERAGSIAENFLSYVWYLASVAEDAGEDPDARIQPYLESTLAWQQLAPSERRRWLAVSGRGVTAYRSSPAATRRRWSRAGTTIPTAALIEQMASQIASVVVSRPLGDEPIDDLLDVICREQRLGHLLGLPESGVPAVRNQRGGRGTQRIGLDALGLLKAWVSGTDIQELADEFLREVPDGAFRLEQLADFVTAAFDNFLPWAFALLTDWVNVRLRAESEYTGELLPTSLPSFVRYGVDSAEAVRLIRGGVVSRRLASAVARAYRETSTGDDDLRAWLCAGDLADWRTRFGASPMDLRALLEFARPQGNRLAARLLGGELVTIAIRTVLEQRIGDNAYLAEVDDEPSPARLGVWLDDVLVAYVPPEHSAELEAIRGTGLPILISLATNEEGVTASVRLADLSQASEGDVGTPYA